MKEFIKRKDEVIPYLLDITLEQYRNDAHHQLIHDTIDELRDWACFDEDFYYEDDM